MRRQNGKDISIYLLHYAGQGTKCTGSFEKRALYAILSLGMPDTQ